MMAATDPTQRPLGELGSAMLDQWRRVADGVAATTDWQAPTRLAGWTAQTLLGHLVVVGEAIPRTLRETPTSAEPISVYDVFSGAPSRAADNDSRAREFAAGADADELVARLHAAVAAASDAVEAVDSAAVLPTRFGALPVADFLVHRVVEGVVHGLDLPHHVPPDETALLIASAALRTLLQRRRPDLVAQVPADPVVWLEGATGRAPPPTDLREALPLLA